MSKYFCANSNFENNIKHFVYHVYKQRTFCVLLLLVLITRVSAEDVPVTTSLSSWTVTEAYTGVLNTELPGGTIKDGQRIIRASKRPYLIREDLIVERDAELVIEAGVQIKFGPSVGITVRGILTAVGTPDRHITFTSAEPPDEQLLINSPKIRLVDGPTTLAGRLQILHGGAWRSVCTNSKNWTRADLETACRQLGYQGGSFHNWVNRQMPMKPRLLFEEPQCLGTERTLQECRWNTRQLGSGVCDYHPDLGIECLPYHANTLNTVHYWRGIRFENAAHNNILTLSNTLYVPTSHSRMQYVDITYAGSGREYNTTSALHVIGVPPVFANVQILHSAFNGMNISNPEGPILIRNCTIRNNRGYGIYVNSSYGLAHIDGCVINENGADGIKYVHGEERPEDKRDRSEYSNFCTLPTTVSQTYPILIVAEQSKYSTQGKVCPKNFYARYGQVLTLSLIRMETDRNNSAYFEIFDGTSSSDTLLGKFFIRNHTRPQTLTTSKNRMFVKFNAERNTQLFIYMKLTAAFSKAYDLNISYTTLADNNGRGAAIENLRSRIILYKSSISNNNHVAGLHVMSGVGDVNVSDSRIAFNDGDGINITYTGGNRNISRSTISSNKGYGIAVWINNTQETEYVFFNQTAVVQYSEIFRNLDTGILHGNYCGDAIVNITGNTFTDSKIALEVASCWQKTNEPTKLFIGYNKFISTKKLAVKIMPALNLDGRIEYNHFRSNQYGGILIKNQLFEEFNVHRTNITLHHNEFYNNKGVFVVNLGVSPYSDLQKILFTRNIIRENRIREPFELNDGMTSRMIPRSRVAAPVVISSANVDVFRNILHNLESKYEVGSHLEDQSMVINCTFNWLSSGEESAIYARVFDRKDRYNLAKIQYLPYLLHNSNPGASATISHQIYVPQFNVYNSKMVGGEVEGQEILKAGEYLVERDINVRPGGKLIIEPGVTLNFPPSIGMMVGGKLEARGRYPNDITFTLKEELVVSHDNDTYETDTERYDTETEVVEIESKIPIRLLGGKTNHEGRLQVKIKEEWGTVCNYGWTIRDASLVCQQLGLVLNPDDWFLERNEMPSAGTTERVILSNVQCDDEDIDITSCKAEYDFEKSCSHDLDVGVRCYESSWAGLRLSPIAERSDMQYITIEKAGLLDYATNLFKPALQIDFAKHSLESVTVRDNYHDGIGVVYADIYSQDAINIIKNSIVTNNRGNGISFKQLGMKIQGTTIENNQRAGISHNPAIAAFQQREIAGWFNLQVDESNYRPTFLPQTSPNIDLDVGETKYLVTSKVFGDSISRLYNIKCRHGYVIGIQLLNPIQNLSTEVIDIFDAQNIMSSATAWSVRRDLNVFPTTSSSFGIVMRYESGSNAIGGTVLVITALQAPVQNLYNRIIKGPVPTLTLVNSNIKRNRHALKASYYNRYLNELGDHFLRKANETIKIINCDISHNIQEAVFIYAPFWDIHESNISEIRLMINNSLITDNGKGIYHFARDMRSSNNLFHYVLQDNSIERNAAGGFEVNLPYVWQYDENFTHSVFLNNNTWRDNQNFQVVIDGHFATVNITKNVFTKNKCKEALLRMKGMEKKLRIDGNKIEMNSGKYMIQFKADSQSEILGEVYAYFYLNEIRMNSYSRMRNNDHSFSTPTSVIEFSGIQKVNILRNIFSGNGLDYVLIAGIRTAKVDSILNVRENWWGTDNISEIHTRIFDFDDWNNHAIADFHPYLIEEAFDSSLSVTWDTRSGVDLENLGGRLSTDLVLNRRLRPYVIKSDITIMPGVTLKILPDVVLEFAPNVGILVLGTLKARGLRGQPIEMRPIRRATNEILRKRSLEQDSFISNIRLCTGRNCSTNDNRKINEGFVEYFNATTLQWIPMCDTRFTERNAQVVCSQLGFDSINIHVDHEVRIEYHSNSLSRIWSWPEPLECVGTEKRYDECPIRLNGQLYGHRYECEWNSRFVFINCGERNLEPEYDYWGGIRFAGSEFEQRLYEHRIHDIHTHETVQRVESEVEFVNIHGAGMLHNEKSPTIQSIIKSPSISFVNITNSASDGINLISPSDTMRLLFNNIHNSLGVGVNVLSLTGEGREASESSFVPLKDIVLPYNLFSLIDICDTTKEIILEERVLLYYKYDNHPVNCVKIFKSAYNIKPFGFRLLQFNLFNSTSSPTKPDMIQLYDGDIYNVTRTLIRTITVGTQDEKTFFKTKSPRLSVKLFANGASANHGFIAEVVTLPISAIGFNRDVQHNISHSELTNNRKGAIVYASVGEVNPIVTMEKNHFNHNCVKLYGNLTTCKAAIDMDIQNTQTLYFRNNLVKSNQGGLSVKADSRGSATSLKGWIHNNLFVENMNRPTLYLEGRQSSPYQEVTIYRNYFAKNRAAYENLLILKQVVSNFTLNYVHNNLGAHILEVSGFDKVRLPIYQTTSHNGFYRNFAIERDSRSTVVAGTAGQHYVDNIFFNPDNDYEIVTVNRSIFVWNSTLEQWKTKIDATHNYWGYNDSLAVSGRIRDVTDDMNLLEVNYEPFYMNNKTILNGKCPPGWNLVGDTCYIFIGAPMTFEEARSFCRSDNASMPYVMSNYIGLYQFLKKQNQWYQYSDRVWIQHIDKINKCTVFTYQAIEIDNCDQKNPFLCEIDPKILIDPLSWRGDTVTIAVLSTVAATLLLIIGAVACWCSKNKHRHVQRLERRNSIRQSLHSLRSVGSSHGFTDLGYRRGKGNAMSARSTDTLTTKHSDYKKMATNGSLDSMDKSAFNSSIEDNQSYDIYEAHNPNPAGFSHFTNEYPNSVVKPKPQASPYASTPVNTFDLAYKNEGFRDNSTFASKNNSNYQSRAESVHDNTTSEETPIIHSQEGAYGGYPPNDYYNTDTLPLNSTLAQSDSTLDLKRELEETMPFEEDRSYTYSPESPKLNFLQELKSKMPSYNSEENYPMKPTTFGQKYIDLPPKPPTPTPAYDENGLPYSPSYDEKLENLNFSPDNYNMDANGYYVEDRPKSTALLETDLDSSALMPKNKSKSEALLETNFDLQPNEDPQLGQPISEANRSQSQPLETAM